MKRCPSCSQILVRRRIEGIEVDGCPSCGGAWLDDGELAALGKRDPNNLRELDKHFVAGAQEAVGAHRSNNCPVCNQPLASFEYGSLAGIQLDGCRQCKGVWLDDGEATQIADRLDPAGARPAAEPGAHDDDIFEIGHAAPAGAALGAVVPASALRPASRPIEVGVPAGATPADPTSTNGMPLVRGTHLGRVHHFSSFGSKISSALTFIRAAYGLAFERKVMLVPIILGLVAQLVLAGVAFAIYWFGLSGLGTSAEAGDPTAGIVLTVFGVGYSFLAHFINYFTLGMAVNMVDAYLKGMEPTLGVAFADAVKNLGGIFALAVVGTIVQMIVSSLRNNRSIFSRVIASTIESFWTVASFLLLPIIIVEDIGLFKALGRAKDMHRRNLVQIAVGEIGINIINFLIVLVAVGIAALLYLALQSMGTVGLVIAIATGALLVSVIGVFISFAKGAYYTCLYLWAAETERAPETARVPSPLAAVFS